jgi:hypothetical protein
MKALVHAADWRTVNHAASTNALASTGQALLALRYAMCCAATVRAPLLAKAAVATWTGAELG